MAASAVLAVRHGGHKDASTALSIHQQNSHTGHTSRPTYAVLGALASQTLDRAVSTHPVILENGELVPIEQQLATRQEHFMDSECRRLALALDLLGRRVHLLLALLGTTTEAEHQVEGGLLLDVVV